MELLQWYFDFSVWTRVKIALAPIIISTVMYFCGLFWPWGWGVGVLLLCFAFTSDD